MNGEVIELIPIRNAHTDGDTLVHFVNRDILMTGDYYRSIQYPNIDRANGGSLNGMLDGLTLTIALCGPNTKVIPGHGGTVDRAALVTHRDMILALRDKVAPLVKQGRTLEQVTAAKLTAEFDSKISMPGTTADRFIGQLYAELQAAK
jgi:cyclase